MDASGTYSLKYEFPRGTTMFMVRCQDFEGSYPPGYATATLSR